MTAAKRAWFSSEGRTALVTGGGRGIGRGRPRPDRPDPRRVELVLEHPRLHRREVLGEEGARDVPVRHLRLLVEGEVDPMFAAFADEFVAEASRRNTPRHYREVYLALGDWMQRWAKIFTS